MATGKRCETSWLRNSVSVILMASLSLLSWVNRPDEILYYALVEPHLFYLATVIILILVVRKLLQSFIKYRKSILHQRRVQFRRHARHVIWRSRYLLVKQYKAQHRQSNINHAQCWSDIKQKFIDQHFVTPHRGTLERHRIDEIIENTVTELLQEASIRTPYVEQIKTQSKV